MPWRIPEDSEMATETELKFAVKPHDLRKLKAARVFRRTPPREEELTSVYFDTPKHQLANNGVSLRVRRVGDKRLQTIKSGQFEGSFRRGEWEQEIKGDVPNLRNIQGTALAPLLTKKLKHNLKPIFETRIHRTSVPVRKNGSRIEVALDEGQVRAGRKFSPIGELELELKRGKARDVFKLGRDIGQLVPAQLAFKSKSERGYDLIEDRPAQAIRAEKIKLRRSMSTADAFRTIGRSVLRHITANQAAVQGADSEGVHQMRVGLRRLRAAMSLFSKLLGDKQTEQIKSELKWLVAELAPARDLDVYERDTVEPLRRAAPSKHGMKELEDVLESRRVSAFAKAKIAVDSPRYRSLLLDTLQWLEIGDWTKRSRRYGVRPIERFAADILARRTQKAKKKTKRLRELDTQERHKLRIAMKKLRYAIDFFEHLFQGHKARKRMSRFKECLEHLQDRLGALNDIKVHQKLAPKLAAGKSHTKARERAFAAGIVSGREQSKIEPLLKAANKDARKFAHLGPFWT
jgi:inorganic triphosphatase YgiF